ncbi:MAG: response regulator [Elusimicrobia bacterium]|nr:response regulator [Elusimicrobiota bacterium]
MADENPTGRPQDKLILIVDDDDSVRELLEFLVRKEGFKVDTAADGEEGINKIQKLLPDLVILDLMLPRYGGFEILRQLQTGETAKIPIIIVTGRYTDRTTAEMIRQESNVLDFLEKPVKANILTMSLHKILKTTPPEMNPAAGQEG